MFIALSFPLLSNHYFALAGRYFLGLLEQSLRNYLSLLREREPVADLLGLFSGGWLFASSSYPVFTEDQLICVCELSVCAFETADGLTVTLKMPVL